MSGRLEILFIQTHYDSGLHPLTAACGGVGSRLPRTNVWE